MTEDAIILSEAAKMQLEPATASLANVMNQFNTESSESRRIINELAAGSQAGSGDIQYLSDAIEKCGTTAYLMGMKTNEAVGIIEAVAPKFNEASMAGNSLDKVLLKMKEKQIGYKDGVFNVNLALEELETRMAKGESTATLFGVEHAKMAEVLVQAKDDVIYYTNAVTNSDKAVEMAAKNTNNSVAERAQAMNRLKLQMIEVGEKISPAITMGTNAFTYFLKTLVQAPQIFSQNKELIIALVASLVALTGKTILATAATVKSKAAHLLDAASKQKNALMTSFLNERTEQYNKTQGRLHPALLNARTAFTLLGKAMLANPIGTLILGFTAIRAALQLYDKNNATSLRLEREKRDVMTSLNGTVESLTSKYNAFKTILSGLNQLSLQEKKDLKEKIALTIKDTEAEIANYRAKQLSIRHANEQESATDLFMNTLKNFGDMPGMLAANIKSAAENGKKAAEELDPALNKLLETLTSLKDGDINLSNILNAETNADKIGTSSITQLNEKIRLYQVALENAVQSSEEFNRIQQKLMNTQNSLNKAIKDRNYTTDDDNKSAKKAQEKEEKEAEKLAKKKEEIEEQLSKKIREIRAKINVNSVSENEKEFAEAEAKYDELLRICNQYNLDATEIYDVYQEEISSIITKQLEEEVIATLDAEDKIKMALASSSEQQKVEVRKKYEDLIALAKKHGIDTVALQTEINAKMEKELEMIPDSGGAKLLGLSEEDWEELENKITTIIDLAGQLTNIWGQFNQIQNNQDKKELQDYEKNTNKKKELLNKQLNSGRISQEKYNAQVAQLDADTDKKKAEIARKQAKRERALAITGVLTNTATAIMRIWADVPKFDFGVSTAVLTGIAAATGALQLAAILSEPLPEFAQGGMTDGARMYIAGEAGREWIAPNNMINDPITGPIIQQLELVRSGTLSPDQLKPLAPDFATMTSIPMYATGDPTAPSQSTTNYYQTSTEDSRVIEVMQSMRNEIKVLNEYMSDPRNRQAYISNDRLRENEKEMSVLEKMKRF